MECSHSTVKPSPLFDVRWALKSRMLIICILSLLFLLIFSDLSYLLLPLYDGRAPGHGPTPRLVRSKP
jgi:hypothetical protein